MREVKINIAELKAEYVAGTRNEDNATKLIITPPADCIDDTTYYLLMFESQTGKLDVSERLTLNTDKVIEYTISNSLTHTAYQMTSLVGYQENDDGVEMVYRSTPFKLKFKPAVIGDQFIDEPNRGYIAELLGMIKSGMIKGEPGADGTSIVNVEIVMQHLIIELSTGEKIDAGIVNDNLPYYGVCRDRNSHSPTLTRCGQAVGLEANKGIGSTFVRNDFDYIYPYSKIRRCTLADDGTVTAYKGDVNYTEDGSAGQVQVEIPKFYELHYINPVTNKEYWYISEYHLAGFRLSQAFYDAEGNELDKIYIGAFPVTFDKDNNMAQSISGKGVYHDTCNGSDMFERCAARGNNWHELDAMEYADVIVPLFLVEWATLDSQSVFTAALGKGGDYAADESTYGTRSNIIKVSGIVSLEDVTLHIGEEVAIDVPIADAEFIPDELDEYYAEEGNDPFYTAVRKITQLEIITPEGGADSYLEIKFSGSYILMNEETKLYPNDVRNGITNDVAASSGECFYSADGYSPWVWRGLENLYGIGFTWLAGILYENSELNVWEDLRHYVSRDKESRISLGYTIPSNNQYISDLGYNPEYPWACFPAKGDGTSDTDFCDSLVSNAGITRFYAFGGNSAPEGGLFGCYTPNVSLYTNHRAGRLSYKSFA